MGYTDRPPGQGGQGQGIQKSGQGGGQQGEDQGIRTDGGDFESKSGRQGPGEIPNPEDENDRGSHSGFDGNAAEELAADNDEDEEEFGAVKVRTKEPSSQPRQRN